MDEPRYIEFEPGEKHAGKKAAISYTMDSFQDCGYLLQDDDVVVDIDCLSRSQINQLLQWFDIKTMRVWTDRGIHLYYKKPPDFGNAISSGLCLLGFKIEQKTKKNTPGGLTVKRDGVERKIENADIRETLPLMFRKRYKGNSLLGMSEGDGRNNELYSLKRALHNCNGWDSILRFVNQHIFAEPLNQDEFASVARQENITEKSKESDIALEIINRLSCVIYNRGIWFKDKGNYISDTKDERLIRRIYDIAGNRTTRSIDEIVKTIEYRAPVIEDVDNGFPIKFKNGILYPSGRFVPMESPEDFTTFTPYCIDIPYYKNAEPVEVVDKYIADLTGGEKEYRDLLLEALGFTFVTDRDTVNALGKFFILRGDGRNGKGTFLRIISTILGKKNCSSLSITQLGDPKYAVNIIGKLANLGDDV